MSATDTASYTSSSLRRLGSGTSNRLTESLLSSSGSIAAVGLVTALLTTGFVLWFVLELRQQSTITAPMARTAAVLNASLNRSIAALRGWTAYGDQNFISTRQEIWVTNIEPSLLAMEQYSRESYDSAATEHVLELGAILRQLKFVQWKIQDVAQTPGNNPPMVYYEMRLKPLRNNLLNALLGATRAYRSNQTIVQDTELVANLMTLYADMIIADWWLRDYLDEGDDYYADNARGVYRQLELAAQNIEIGLQKLPQDDIYHALRWSLDNFSSWLQQSEEVIALREPASGHMARVYMQREAKPLLERALKLSSELAETHAMAMENRTDTLSRASYAVTAMALLMGLLSAGSLVFSYRLKGQVHSVLEKARKLGQYELERQIGQGGMGEVYLAHHAMMRRPTAIKLLRALSAQNLRAQQRFQREVKLACQLNHPSTIEIYDYGRTPAGIFYYAMEYLDGFCIDAMVQVAGPVPPARMVHLLTQACGSLAEAHAMGILHRDIKPSNIMVTQLGGVYDTTKVLDFGLARELGSDDSNEAKLIAGTPLYLAPEVILSAASYSAQSDIYALGALAYFMLCGQTIFPPADLPEILAMQLEDNIPFPSERLGYALPTELEFLVMSCLAKDPAQRPASANRLATLLAACDCPVWTADDARHWWQTYGEAACSVSQSTADPHTASRQGAEMMLDASKM
jgi:serine/threonine protein kinase